MSEIRHSVSLDKESFWGLNVGCVIKLLFDFIEQGCDNVLVKVSNEYMRGIYTVPVAVGFSTPIRVLKGGEIIFKRNETTTSDFRKLYDKWNMIYSGAPICKPNIWKYTSDNQGCQICLESYNLGEEIRQLDCGHKFHKECILAWEKKHIPQDSEQAMAMIIFKRRPSFRCPICDKIQRG